MSDSSRGEGSRKEISRTNEYFAQANNYQPRMIAPPHYFTQHMYYPYVNPYSHLTEANGNLSIHGYGSDGRPKFRRSRTIFSPEQLDILEEHFTKYNYPDVKRRRAIAADVGLPDERVQVWFQNRRAKQKRHTDQQVKLKELVDQAIGSNAENKEKLERNSDHGFPVSHQNEECEENPFGRPQPHDADKETENDDSRTFHSTQTKFPRLKECELANESLRNCSVSTVSCDRGVVFPGTSERQLPDKAGDSQNLWLQSSASSFGAAEAQVVVQSIDQDLLCKVANILSASNDANSLISEWSQTPNKTHTNNLEEQLRNFADHHQQVLTVSQQGRDTIPTSSNNTSTQKDLDKI